MATEREKKKRIIGCNEIFLRLPWQNLYKRYEAVINVIVHFFYCANAVRAVILILFQIMMIKFWTALDVQHNELIFYIL